MFSNSAKNDGSPPSETEQANKILLLMFAALALLIFMDSQARRHYRELGVAGVSAKSAKSVKKAGRKAARSTRRRMDEIRERVLPPMRKSARDIFGSALPGRNMLHEPAIPSPGSRSYRNAPAANNRKEIVDGPRAMFLYFIRFRGGRSVLTRVKRNVPAAGYTPVSALRLLQKGSLPEERGLMTVLTRDSLIVDLQVGNGTALVELGAGFPAVTPRLIRDRIDQVKYTLLQFPEIQRVKFAWQGRIMTELRDVPVDPPRRRRILDYRP